MSFKSHFKFTKQERSGIFFLLLVIVLIQLAYFAYQSLSVAAKESFTLDAETQSQINDLKAKAVAKDTTKIFPFNPNFITDYKGYTLGMSVEEIDRLHAFRKQNKFANSPKEFQQVTQVSDSLLHAISTYFKFPEWTKTSTQNSYQQNSTTKPIAIVDLNKATAEELKLIRGIGDKLSERIIKFRDNLGGFVVAEQLYDVYGLEAAVAEQALKRFKLLSKPDIVKINLNLATVTELVKLVYIRYSVAQEIVSYREENGGIKSFDELISLEGFPSDKIERIALYLSLKE